MKRTKRLKVFLKLRRYRKSYQYFIDGIKNAETYTDLKANSECCENVISEYAGFVDCLYYMDIITDNTACLLRDLQYRAKFYRSDLFSKKVSEVVK